MPNMQLCPHCMALNNMDRHTCAVCGDAMEAHNGNHQLPVGTLLNKRYYVGCAIGGGGFGITYIGYDILLNIKVAIKEFYPSGAANRSATATVYPVTGSGSFMIGKERFLNEAKILSGFIDDENIVTLRDFFEANGTAYIVMEYLDGQDLREYLDMHGVFTFDEALELVAPAIKALERVHDKGVIHGDISPSNIMRLNNGEIKILDFGTARSESGDESYNASVMLKPGYAPEEQYRANGERGAWTDVYAISATIYKLITNITPESSTDRTYNDTLKAPSRLGARIKPAQEAALLRGMAVSAKERTQTMEALLNSLEKKRLSAGDAVKQLTGSRVFRVAAVAAVAAAIVLGVIKYGKRAENPAINDPAAKVVGASDAAQGSRITSVALSDDAYPVRLYSGMERIEGFSGVSISRSGEFEMNITDCYIGNGMLCFVAEINNLTDKNWSFYGIELNDGNKRAEALDYVNGKHLTMDTAGREKKTIGIWFSTDVMYLQAMNDLNRAEISFSSYTPGNSEYGDHSGTIYFPRTIHINSSVDTTPKALYSNDSYRILCYGLSLRRDHTDALVLLEMERMGTSAYQSVYCEIGGDILIDGTKIFNNGSYYNTYLDEIFGKQSMYFCYGYSTTYDEMNVMHSNTKLPQTIELPLRLDSDYDKKGDIMPATNFAFDIDENGIGHLR